MSVSLSDLYNSALKAYSGYVFPSEIKPAKEKYLAVINYKKWNTLDIESRNIVIGARVRFARIVCDYENKPADILEFSNQTVDYCISYTVSNISRISSLVIHANILKKVGRLKESLEIYRQEMFKGNPDMMFAYATSLKEDGRFEESLFYYKLAASYGHELALGIYWESTYEYTFDHIIVSQYLYKKDGEKVESQLEKLADREYNNARWIKN